MNFASDNVAGVDPAILAALAAANDGPAAPYGADAITARLEARFRTLFECDHLVMIPVATGTAANALALAAAVPPWGAILCHEAAHINGNEAGAPEFYTAGAKLVTLPGDDGKLTAATLEQHLPGGLGNVHTVQPAAVSLSQSTELGTLYRPEELGAIAAVTHRHGLSLHVDGARFANALVSLGVSPAEATWRAGVDLLSFGATKNGAMAAEAILVFEPALARDLGHRRKRAGHLFSKMRFLSAQLEAYLDQDRWLANARHANAMAARLARGLDGIAGVRLRHPVETNQLFVEVPEAVAAGLAAAGFGFYRWDETPAGPCLRLVTAWNTAAADIEALVAAAAGLARG